MNKRISVIGCGWLGLPVAKFLVDNQYIVKGSTTSKSKLIELDNYGINSHLIRISAEQIDGQIENCLANSTTLILNIPPKLIHNTEANSYVQRIKLLIPYIEQSSVQNVLFISSTSVYNNEKDFPVITEGSLINPKSESGKQIFEVERLLQNNPNFKTTIVRFSGLIGKERHPAKTLSGKTGIKNPDSPVNLIHLEDCIAILFIVLEQGVWNEVFNVSAETHPSKKDYYTSICKQMHLPVPKFDDTMPSVGKIIAVSKLVQLLEYRFKVKL